MKIQIQQIQIQQKQIQKIHILHIYIYTNTTPPAHQDRQCQICQGAMRVSRVVKDSHRLATGRQDHPSTMRLIDFAKKKGVELNEEEGNQ